MVNHNLHTEEGARTEPSVHPETPRLVEELRESSLRHYVWGATIAMVGLFVLFGMWFLLGG